MVVRPETVTVLFSDVVGSTAWRARVGDGVADVRTAELERASRQVVDSSGGTVVKGVGDGVMATFGSAVAGLDAAAATAGGRPPAGGRRQSSCACASVSAPVTWCAKATDWLGAAAIEASGSTVPGSSISSASTARCFGPPSSTGPDEPMAATVPKPSSTGGATGTTGPRFARPSAPQSTDHLLPDGCFQRLRNVTSFAGRRGAAVNVSPV